MKTEKTIKDVLIEQMIEMYKERQAKTTNEIEKIIYMGVVAKLEIINSAP